MRRPPTPISSPRSTRWRKARIDAIALTSSGQVRRLIEVAQAHGCEARLRDGLARTPIASVGPVVSDELDIARLARRHHAGQRRLFHEAADIGDGGRA
jgi:uroporphyrinogen-III synthase